MIFWGGWRSTTLSMGGGDPFLARLGVYTDRMVGDIEKNLLQE